ncbi:putative carrier protein PET8 [Aphelenchoides bicaudatus]|nr:putative carrier protein PET8 [Aphelenchoides bicaudatus]
MLPDNVRWLAAGASAGLAVDLSLYPIDTLKTRLQSHQGFYAAGGFKNVYRGMGSVALGSAPGSALFFLTYSSMKQLFKTDCTLFCRRLVIDCTFKLNQSFDNDNNEAVWCDAVRASFGEFAACLVRVPTEVVKQRAQVSSGASIGQITRQLWQTNGLATFYRGFGSTLTREIPFAFVEYPLWEYLKRKWAINADGTVVPLKSALCGSVAGAISAGVTTPLDVAKTRIMLGSTSSSSTYLVLMEIAKREGYRQLFSGTLPRCTWMGIGGCIYFFAYEYNASGINVLFKTSRCDYNAHAEVGDTILDCVINNDLPIDGFGACEGSMECSTCHVILESDHFARLAELSTAELDLLDEVPQPQKTSRLGCQVILTKADKPQITITVPSERHDARTSN